MLLATGWSHKAGKRQQTSIRRAAEALPYAGAPTSTYGGTEVLRSEVTGNPRHQETAVQEGSPSRRPLLCLRISTGFSTGSTSKSRHATARRRMGWQRVSRRRHRPSCGVGSRSGSRGGAQDRGGVGRAGHDNGSRLDDRVVATLDRVAVDRGAPVYVRFDNGPEFAAAVADWCRFNRVSSVFIDPGSPWQNAWIESFNGRLRDELLNGWSFGSVLEAQVLVEGWRIDYNNNRPHSAHGELTPVEYAHAWTTTNQPQLASTPGPATGDPSRPVHGRP